MVARKKNIVSENRPDGMSVSEITALVKENVEKNFPDIWIIGEISNLTRASSGHIYLTLKDESAQLRGVVWRGAVPMLAIEPADGLEVLCHGRLEVYAARGTYQVSIDKMHVVGMGVLESRLLLLREKLLQEGLFDPHRKRPLPEFPKRIVLVTSPSGAAICDFLETLKARWSVAEVFVMSVRVQGAGAAEEIAEAIRQANLLSLPIDALVIARGGGSLEDLWAFNEEVLVRAIADSRIPVVSGVGHEIDSTLADLAADVRALTPTDAAVKVSPVLTQVLDLLNGLLHRAHTALVQRANQASERFDSWSRRLAMHEPSRTIQDRSDFLDRTSSHLASVMRVNVERASERLRAAAAQLEANSPLAILARGYCVAWTDDHVGVLHSIANVQSGAFLTTQCTDGRIISRVLKTESVLPVAPH